MNHQVWRIDIVRLAALVDPPAASQNQALDEVAIFAGSLYACRRFDHSSRDAWKTQPVELSDFRIVCCAHRSVPIAVERVATQYPDDLIPRIVNQRLRDVIEPAAGTSDSSRMVILIVGLAVLVSLYIAVRLALRYFFRPTRDGPAPWQRQQKITYIALRLALRFVFPPDT